MQKVTVPISADLIVVMNQWVVFGILNAALSKKNCRLIFMFIVLSESQTQSIIRGPD